MCGLFRLERLRGSCRCTGKRTASGKTEMGKLMIYQPEARLSTTGTLGIHVILRLVQACSSSQANDG